MNATIANEVTVNKKSWDDNTARLIERANPLIGVPALKEAVQKGSISLYELCASGVSLGVFFVRGERLFNGRRELVILYGAAEQKIKVPFVSLAAPFVKQIAYDQGFDSIRIHSERRGLDAVAQECGYKFVSSIFRLELR